VEQALPIDRREVPDEILALLGEMLLLVQDFEYFLAFVVDAVMEGDKKQARGNLLREDPRTIGRLLTLLRRKATLIPDFDAVLASTLKERNLFTHGLQRNYDLLSAEGLRALLLLMDAFQSHLFAATDVLKALILGYGRELGVGDAALEHEWRMHGDLDHLERMYLPHVSQYSGRRMPGRGSGADRK
jgi:hypothetical protein